jgi:hypothetical protein
MQPSCWKLQFSTSNGLCNIYLPLSLTLTSKGAELYILNIVSAVAVDSSAPSVEPALLKAILGTESATVGHPDNHPLVVRKTHRLCSAH